MKWIYTLLYLSNCATVSRSQLPEDVHSEIFSNAFKVPLKLMSRIRGDRRRTRIIRSLERANKKYRKELTKEFYEKFKKEQETELTKLRHEFQKK